MKRQRFYLSLSADQWLMYYKGQVQSIVVTTFTGTRLSVPARNFVPFVSHSGIQGTFEISFDANNRIVSLHKF